MLTAREAHRLLAYDPETGVVTRRVSINSRARAGGVFGGLNCDGYLVAQIDGKKHMVHRVIWLMVYGVWPELEIDHENTIRSDNRLRNLREATHSQNRFNTGAKPGTTSGLKGVYWHKRASKWAAQIVAFGRHFYLGLFETPEAAHIAYCQKAAELHGEFARFYANPHA